MTIDDGFFRSPPSRAARLGFSMPGMCPPCYLPLLCPPWPRRPSLRCRPVTSAAWRSGRALKGQQRWRGMLRSREFRWRLGKTQQVMVKWCPFLKKHVRYGKYVGIVGLKLIFLKNMPFDRELMVEHCESETNDYVVDSQWINSMN